MEQKLNETYQKEETMFHYHPSEERVVLSHALFWVLSGSLKGKIRQEKCLLLLRQYEEEMLSITAISEGDAKQEAFDLVYDRRIGVKGTNCERTEVIEITDEV